MIQQVNKLCPFFVTVLSSLGSGNFGNELSDLARQLVEKIRMSDLFVVGEILVDFAMVVMNN